MMFCLGKPVAKPTQTLSKRGEPWSGRTYNCDWPARPWVTVLRSFAVALGLALLEQRYGLRDLEVWLCLFAIALTVCMRDRVLGFLLCSRAYPNNNRTISSMHSLPPNARDWHG